MSRDLDHRPVLDVVAGEGLVAGGQCGLDPVASHHAAEVHLAGDLLALGDLRRAAGDGETLGRSRGGDDLAAEGGQVAGHRGCLSPPSDASRGDGEVRQDGSGVVPRRHSEAGSVFGGSFDRDLIGGDGGVSRAGRRLVRCDSGPKNSVACGDLDRGCETVAARIHTGRHHSGPEVQIEVAGLVPVGVEVDRIGQFQVLRSAGNSLDRADAVIQQGVVQLGDGAQSGVRHQGRWLALALVDVEGARPGHFVTVRGGAGPGPLVRHGVGLNGDVSGALRGDGRWDANSPGQTSLGVVRAMTAGTGCVVEPFHGDVGIGGSRSRHGCGGDEGKSQGNAQEAPPRLVGWGGREVHEHAFR